MFVGLVPEIKLSGEDGDVVWVGVKFDEPLGKNDGSVKGVKYFDAGGAKMGGFQRAQMVKTGDYPIVDEMDDLTDSDVDEEL
jgi:tubulin-folding cofactor B